eukprot:gene12696-517_t
MWVFGGYEITKQSKEKVPIPELPELTDVEMIEKNGQPQCGVLLYNVADSSNNSWSELKGKGQQLGSASPQSAESKNDDGGDFQIRTPFGWDPSESFDL